jgi:lysophospholipase L1-like esterase
MPAMTRGGPSIIVLAVVVAGWLASTAAAAEPVRPGSTYLALGDSVTFGYQEAQVVPPPRYHDASSFVAYPQLVGRALRLRVVNPACPGETSASLIDASAPSNGCENVYRRAYPLHVRYRGSQLGFAVRYLRRHRDVRLVSLMIGANDLYLCQKTTSDGCATELAPTLRRIGRNARRIVSALRGRGRYRGQLVIVAYYAPDYTSAFYVAVIRALNRTVRDAARPFGIAVADGFGRWRAAARHSAGNSCTAGLLTQLGAPGTCGVHPSYAGHGLLALAVADALQLGGAEQPREPAQGLVGLRVADHERR